MLNEWTKQYEGGLFLDVHFQKMGDSAMFFRDLYTVKDGRVYEIRNGKLTQTDDELSELDRIWRIGTYDPKQNYEIVPVVQLSGRAINDYVGRLLAFLERNAESGSDVEAKRLLTESKGILDWFTAIGWPGH